DFAGACYSLGNELFLQGKNRDAAEVYQKAIRLKPDHAEAYNNLGMALGRQQNHAEAEAAFRKAVGLAPGLLNARINLGTALLGQEKLAEAEAEFRKTIAVKPDAAPAHHQLGVALMRQARFREAATSLADGAELFSTNDPRREQARQLQQQCQRYASLDAKVPALLRGTFKPENATEQIEFAQLCVLKKQYSAAAELFRGAFKAEPKLGEDVKSGTRYMAACAAALTGC